VLKLTGETLEALWGIITVASLAGFQPGPWQTVCGATKAFALAFSEALWEETR
jgi:uncharacterized protein